MAFAVSSKVTGPAARHFFFLEEDVRVGTRFLHMVGSGGSVGDFQQLLERQALHGFTHALAVLAFFHPPVPNLFDDFFHVIVRGFTGNERHEQRTHLGAVHHGSLGAHEDARAAFVTDVQSAGHVIDEHSAVIFNGDGYSEVWHKEAERRGLPNLRTTPEALAELTKPEVVNLYEKAGVLNRAELKARQEIYLEQYCKTVRTEANLVIRMLWA